MPTRKIIVFEHLPASPVKYYRLCTGSPSALESSAGGPAGHFHTRTDIEAQVDDEFRRLGRSAAGRRPVGAWRPLAASACLVTVTARAVCPGGSGELRMLASCGQKQKRLLRVKRWPFVAVLVDVRRLYEFERGAVIEGQVDRK